MNKIFFVFLILDGCATQEFNLSFNPSGNGISTLSKTSTQKYFLENACKGNAKRFRTLIDVDNKFVVKSNFYKKYNLEIIEVHRLQTYKNPFEVKITQSGCTDEVISLDVRYDTKTNSFKKTLKLLNDSLFELPFDKEVIDVKTDFQHALVEIESNQSKYCKKDINFVAYEKRVLCNIRHKGLYYQLLWGLIEGQDPVINYSSSVGSF